MLDTVASGDGLRVTLADEDVIGPIVNRLSAEGVLLRSVVPWRPGLEDLYFAVRREHELDAVDRPAVHGDDDTSGAARTEGVR